MSHDAGDHDAAPAGGPVVLGVSEKNPRCRTVRLDREPLGVEATFLPAILTGLGVTARHFFSNVFGRKYTASVEYPEQKPPYPERYRGVHRLMRREDGTVRCVACMLCPTVCPAHCITINPGERTDSNEKFPVLFEIDELKCVVCGLCVEACPCDAIRMDTGVHMPPVAHRFQAVLGKNDLLSRGAPSVAVQGGVADWRRERPGVGWERGESAIGGAGPRETP